MSSPKKENSGKKETVGEWARLAKVAPAELTKVGPEKVQENLHPGKKAQRIPDWVFDNDFDGQPPLNPSEELNRMEKELANVVTEIEKLTKRSIQVGSKRPPSPGPDLAADIASLLDADDSKSAGTGSKPKKDKDGNEDSNNPL